MTLEQEHHHNNHRPVLLEQTLEYLAPKPGERYLDLTAGYGGHASAILAEMSPPNAVLIDRDQNAINVLNELDLPGTTLIKQDFLGAIKALHSKQERFDMVLADLGVSSPQLDNADRGFSFLRDGPLDMRMDQNPEIMDSAADLINSATQEELYGILRTYGQEPFARRISEAVVNERPITRTTQLADIVERATPRTPSHRRKTHPATRTFQAIRIAVNEELSQLESALPLMIDLLNEGGRVVIISFHSLEDRVVKQFFKDESRYPYESRLSLLTKRPLSGATNDRFHSRARSSKLRAAVKIKTQKERSTHAYRGKNEPLSYL